MTTAKFHPPVWANGPPAYQERYDVRQFNTLEDCCDYWDHDGPTPTFIAASKVKKKPIFQLWLTKDPPCAAGRFTSAVYPLLQDAGCDSEVRYTGMARLDNGTRCFTFVGWCPVHKRDHDSAKFQLQQHPEKDSAYWKCFRDNSCLRLEEVPLLKYL